MSGYTIIDVDTHVTETPDVWTSRVPATMQDRVPRIDLDAKGRHRAFNARATPRTSSAAAATGLRQYQVRAGQAVQPLQRHLEFRVVPPVLVRAPVQVHLHHA